MGIFDKYHQTYNRITLPVLIDATKDKVQAISYVLDSDLPFGTPSDDYTKEMLKHLKFFWGQGDNKTLGLDNFGISTVLEVSIPESKIKTKKEKAPVSAEAVNSLLADISQASKEPEIQMPKTRGRKRNNAR